MCHIRLLWRRQGGDCKGMFSFEVQCNRWKGDNTQWEKNTRIPFIVELCSTRSIFYNHSFDDILPSKFMKIKQRLVALQITSVFNIHIQYNELQQSVSDKKLWYVIHVPINVIHRPHNVFGSLKLLHYKYEFTLIMCDSCNCCNRL